MEEWMRKCMWCWHKGVGGVKEGEKCKRMKGGWCFPHTIAMLLTLVAHKTFSHWALKFSYSNCISVGGRADGWQRCNMEKLSIFRFIFYFSLILLQFPLIMLAMQKLWLFLCSRIIFDLFFHIFHLKISIWIFRQWNGRRWDNGQLWIGR
jgi:hypothetical protein